MLSMFSKPLTDGNFVEKGVWIGLNDLGSEGTFQWSDGSAVTFKKWGNNRPNALHKLQDCVKAMPNSRWNDASCGTQLYFVCEKN